MASLGKASGIWVIHLPSIRVRDSSILKDEVIHLGSHAGLEKEQRTHLRLQARIANWTSSF